MQGYVDVATFSDLASSTGGSLYQYTPFNAAMDHDLVLNDLKWNLVCVCVFVAMCVCVCACVRVRMLAQDNLPFWYTFACWDAPLTQLKPQGMEAAMCVRCFTLRPQGMEAVMRVRCSAGLDVKSYSGHFFRMPSNPTDVYLPAIDADKALLANIVHTEKLQPGTECFVQVCVRACMCASTRVCARECAMIQISRGCF
eukprot:1158358-Pelagomonas_calceolata.AAC.11